ncbi:hypothetical protein [Halorussus halobius]|nr:hypothetical protein [Halorussus halobius]
MFLKHQLSFEEFEERVGKRDAEAVQASRQLLEKVDAVAEHLC